MVHSRSTLIYPSHRRENITGWALKTFQDHYHDPSITKWDIFHYVYAILHHPQYRSRFADNLKRSLTLAPIPPETFTYRLGNRSALDWIIDQYQVTTDKRSGITSDPNRPDDPQYIVRLVAQIIHLSLQTMQIVNSLPSSPEIEN